MPLGEITDAPTLKKESPRETGERPSAEAGPALILIIDDDPSILAIYAAALRMAGHRVETASSAETALQLVEKECPDLIISDVNMPGLDGMAFTQEIRRHPHLQDTQIILMTGNSALANTRQAMNLGADDFLSKPLQLEELYASVQARLKRAEINRRVRCDLVADLRQKLGSTLPHEFLTPLAGILGLAEILRDEIETMPRHELKGLITDIERSGLRLHRTLRNYLWMMEIDRLPQMQPSLLSPQQASDLIDFATRTVTHRHARPFHLEKDLSGAQSFLAEGTAFEIIVEELLGNALQFSPDGQPIRLSLRGRQLRVIDEGKGLTPDQLRAVGAFKQFDRPEFEQQGLGLGLALVQRVCSAMGAHVHLISEAGKGTEAIITFQSPKDF
jgi:two-component system sensor histidine kinase/response regulator